MRVVAISDTHNHEPLLPEGDLLVVAGDITQTGTEKQIASVNDYLAREAPKFKHKPIVVAGNHDFLFETDRERAKQILSAATYLEDEEITIDGFKIYGSPWTPTFFDWAFMKDPGPDLRELWNRIPEGVDLLITHGPPYKILDFCGKNVGCSDLSEVLATKLKYPPRFHVFGHIHESHGCYTTQSTKFYNVSICNEHYVPVNPVTVFEI